MQSNTSSPCSDGSPGIASARASPAHPRPRNQHVWLSGGFGAWVVCERCGHTGICKGCLAERDPNVVRLPDIFCATHDQLEIRNAYRQAMTLTGIFVRLIFLASAVPDSAWQRDASNPLSVKQLVSVTMPDYRVEYLAIPANHDWWEVQVFAPGQDEIPVFHAMGHRTYPHNILSAQPGPWMQALIDTITLREGAWAWH